MAGNPFETEKKKPKLKKPKLRKAHNIKRKLKYILLLVVIMFIIGGIVRIYNIQKSQLSIEFVGELRDTPVEEQYQNGEDVTFDQSAAYSADEDNQYQIIVGEQIKPGVYTVNYNQDIFSSVSIYNQQDFLIHRFNPSEPFVNLPLNQGDKIVLEDYMFIDSGNTITFTAQDKYYVYDYTNRKQSGVYQAGKTLLAGNYKYKLDENTEYSSFVFYNLNEETSDLKKIRVAGDQQFGLNDNDYIDIDDGYLTYKS